MPGIFGAAGASVNSEFRTVTIAREIAEEEAADAYEALSAEIQELRDEIAEIRRRMAEAERSHTANYRGILAELERLREALG